MTKFPQLMSNPIIPPENGKAMTKKLFLAVYVPNGERALIGTTSAKTAASISDDIGRQHKLERTGCRISAATEDDVEEGGFIAVVA